MDDKKIVIERVFDAPVEAVWRAWTTPEEVQKWWGPEGFTSPSIKIDLQVGGKYIYAMRGPEGTEWDKVMYSAGVFEEIVPLKKIVVTDYFSDAEGNEADPTDYGMDKNVPTKMTAIIEFEALDDNKTKLTLSYPTPENEAQFEAMKKSGMQEGWQSSLNKLAGTL